MCKFPLDEIAVLDDPTVWLIVLPLMVTKFSTLDEICVELRLFMLSEPTSKVILPDI
jgi:hypothetical protein